jgi:hypothetical protein
MRSVVTPSSMQHGQLFYEQKLKRPLEEETLTRNCNNCEIPSFRSFQWCLQIISAIFNASVFTIFVMYQRFPYLNLVSYLGSSYHSVIIYSCFRGRANRSSMLISES